MFHGHIKQPYSWHDDMCVGVFVCVYVAHLDLILTIWSIWAPVSSVNISWFCEPIRRPAE